jgi:hypothetical protein
LNPAAAPDSAHDSSRTRIDWWDERGLAVGSPGGTLNAIDTVNSYTQVLGPRINVADNAAFWVDRWGAPVRIVGAMNDTTTLARSATTGLVSMVRSPVGDSVTATFTARGNDSTVTDQTHEGGGSPSAVTTSYVYGNTLVPDRPTQVRTPVDTTSIQYNDSLGVPQLVTSQGGARTRFWLNLANGLIDSVTAYGARVVDTTNWTRSNTNLTTKLAYDLGVLCSPIGRDTLEMSRIVFKRGVKYDGERPT